MSTNQQGFVMHAQQTETPAIQPESDSGSLSNANEDVNLRDKEKENAFREEAAHRELIAKQVFNRDYLAINWDTLRTAVREVREAANGLLKGFEEHTSLAERDKAIRCLCWQLAVVIETVQPAGQWTWLHTYGNEIIS